MPSANNQLPLAHVRQLPNKSWEEHALDTHLRDVATLAAQFASGFGSADWARVAGVWHDLGKYSAEFQKYINNVSGYKADWNVRKIRKDTPQ